MNLESHAQRLVRDRRVWAAAGLLTLAILAPILAPFLPPAIDWHETFYPAARAALAGRSPYELYTFRNAPWSILPVIPLALFSEPVSRAIYLLISLAAFVVAALRLGAKPLTLGAFLISPPVLHCLLNGNNDWLVLIGFTLPPQIGLFFLAIKPQMAWVVGLFWLVEAWREGGIREAARVFGPLTGVTLLSFALFGLWPLTFARSLDLWWNASLWPASIPVGMALLVAALKRRDARYAMGASPCLTPYVLFHSWSAALVALLPSQAEFIAAVAGLWVLVAIRAGVLTFF